VGSPPIDPGPRPQQGFIHDPRWIQAELEPPPVRCWPTTDPLYIAYHDEEWGRPVRDEHRLLERLCLEGFQSGLAWITILRKREHFRAAFHGFDPDRVARFDDADVARLMADAGIVRNRAKIEATIANARATVALHEAGRPSTRCCGPSRPTPTPRHRAPPATCPPRRRVPRRSRAS